MKDELIDLVFSVPALWDKRHKQHHNKHVLAREWKKIAAKVKVTEEEARKCWKNVRQEYGKQIKKIQGRSGDGAENEIVCQWPYFEKLHFLRDQFTPRYSSTNLIDETQDTVESNPEDSNLEESDTDAEQSTSTSITNVLSPSSELQDVVATTSSSSRATSGSKYSVTQTGYKRRITPQIEIGRQLVDIEKEKLALRTNKMSQDPNDDDIGFFNSLLPYVKKLTPRDKLKFRMDMQNSLFEFLYPSKQQTLACLVPAASAATQIEHGPHVQPGPSRCEPVWNCLPLDLELMDKTKMSTPISKAELSTILPSKLKPMNDKLCLNRSSSIDTIKRINTYICSPQSYLLPAMLTTWLKTGQNSLHSSTEKTIFMFRSLIFGTFLFKFLLRGSKPGQEPIKLNLQTVLQQIAANLQEIFAIALQSPFVITTVFAVALVFLAVQMGLCVYLLSQSLIPLGLWFLTICIVYIGYLGHALNRFYLIKRDVKCKDH
ncbi:unnamed protein product [Ceutorhynchus assimilis]|uniref:MADF domain-containing protein n=1 Tax=Ceutorhynchus assimilis TaxID=467358 RepID=A0A9N9MWN4_9CUCU|nr:unnamed protein product [Ceutorhynchus assimilis]